MSDLIDLDRLKARLAELDAEREPLLALIRAAEAYEGIVGQTLFSSGSVTIRRRPPKSSGRAAPIMAATIAEVAETLELLGPLSTSDLADMLAEKPHLNLPPKNRINVLSARLSNSDKFKTRRGVGWWFADRPWPGEEEEQSDADQSLADEAREPGLSIGEVDMD